MKKNIIYLQDCIEGIKNIPSNSMVVHALHQSRVIHNKVLGDAIRKLEQNIEIERIFYNARETFKAVAV